MMDWRRDASRVQDITKARKHIHILISVSFLFIGLQDIPRIPFPPPGNAAQSIQVH